MISKVNFKIIIILIILVIMLIFLILKYEQEAIFIKYLPITLNKEITYEIDEYKITIPLHNFAFIENFDVSLKPSVKYFTFLNIEEINEFYDTLQENSKNHKVYKIDDVLLYYDEDKDTYIQVPVNIYIEDKNSVFKKVKFQINSNETLKKIIESKYE